MPVTIFILVHLVKYINLTSIEVKLFLLTCVLSIYWLALPFLLGFNKESHLTWQAFVGDDVIFSVSGRLFRADKLLELFFWRQ